MAEVFIPVPNGHTQACCHRQGKDLMLCTNGITACTFRQSLLEGICSVAPVQTQTEVVVCRMIKKLERKVEFLPTFSPLNTWTIAQVDMMVAFKNVGEKTLLSECWDGRGFQTLFDDPTSTLSEASKCTVFQYQSEFELNYFQSQDTLLMIFLFILPHCCHLDTLLSEVFVVHMHTHQNQRPGCA